jgi:transposase
VQKALDNIRLKLAYRDAMIKKHYGNGMSIDELAELFGVTRIVILRAACRLRKEYDIPNLRRKGNDNCRHGKRRDLQERNIDSQADDRRACKGGYSQR